VAIGILDSDLDPEQKHKQFAEAAGELAARLFSRNTKESGTSPQFEEMRESLKQSRDPAAAYVLDIADGKLVR